MRPAPVTPAARILAALGLLAASAGAGVPDEGDCPRLGGRGSESSFEDATPTLIREGFALGYSDLPRLRELIPAEVWSHRNVFFSAGMLMEMGPCHRRYRVPAYFSDATERFAARARLDADGNLRGYVAGTPFPPESIAADDPATASVALLPNSATTAASFSLSAADRARSIHGAPEWAAPVSENAAHPRATASSMRASTCHGTLDHGGATAAAVSGASTVSLT